MYIFPTGGPVADPRTARDPGFNSGVGKEEKERKESSLSGVG